MEYEYDVSLDIRVGRGRIKLGRKVGSARVGRVYHALYLTSQSPDWHAPVSSSNLEKEEGEGEVPSKAFDPQDPATCGKAIVKLAPAKKNGQNDYDEDAARLRKEARNYQWLLRRMERVHGEQIPQLPAYLDFGFSGDYFFLALERFGENLRDFFYHLGPRGAWYWSLSFDQIFAEVALQGLEQLKRLHSLDLIHRDVKPQNFLIKIHPHISEKFPPRLLNKKGNEELREEEIWNLGEQIKDLGLVVGICDLETLAHNCPKRKKSPEERRRAFWDNFDPIGTDRFMSISVMLGQAAEDWDDLEAWGYSLAELYLPKGLPWGRAPAAIPRQAGEEMVSKKMEWMRQIRALKKEGQGNQNIEQEQEQQPKEEIKESLAQLPQGLIDYFALITTIQGSLTAPPYEQLKECVATIA